MSNSAISVQSVSKTFGDTTVLREVSREFEEGRVHGIVGNNGSGKTVLMKCICGFLPPSSGKILVRGKQVGWDMDFPDDTGIIIETPGFLPNLTGVKNLELLASLRRRVDREGIRETIRRVGLDPDSKKPVGKYSLGMRQRLEAGPLRENAHSLTGHNNEIGRGHQRPPIRAVVGYVFQC